MNTLAGGASADPIRRFTITVTMDGAASDGLMRLVSVFHRRQIEILQTTYQRVASSRWMVAIVETTDARLRTTALTLRNTIGVTGYEVSPDPDDPDRPDDPDGPSHRSNPVASYAVPTERARTPALQELV